MTNEWALIHEMLQNHCDMLKAGGVGCAINIYTATSYLQSSMETSAYRRHKDIPDHFQAVPLGYAAG